MLYACAGGAIADAGGEPADRRAITSARAFAASAAIGEDPATGSAAGPLCAYLAARSAVKRLAIEQGVELGRPSLLRAAIDGDRVRVGGSVVILAEGAIRL